MEVQVCLVGSRLCCGVPVDYFLLVEERETRWAHYGICVESGGERTVIPAITVSQPGILSLLSRLMHGGVTPVAAGIDLRRREGRWTPDRRPPALCRT